jgi:hypothetical protein
VVNLVHGTDRIPKRGQVGAAVDAYRAVWRHLGALVRAYGAAVVLLALVDLSVVGVPVAAWLTVRWQFVGQVVMLDDEHDLGVLRRSGRLVAHRWWHTAMFAALIWAGIHALGALLGLLALILVTGLPLWVISLMTMLVEVALTPLGAIALTLLYGDARAEKDGAPIDERVPVG